MAENQCTVGKSHWHWENFVPSLCYIGVQEEFRSLFPWLDSLSLITKDKGFWKTAATNCIYLTHSQPTPPGGSRIKKNQLQVNTEHDSLIWREKCVRFEWKPCVWFPWIYGYWFSQLWVEVLRQFCLLWLTVEKKHVFVWMFLFLCFCHMAYASLLCCQHTSLVCPLFAQL